MTDAVTSVAVCTATGVIATPFCAAFGFDPALLWTGMASGLLGCIIAQTLIPNKDGTSMKAIGRLIVGSTLFAGVFTMICAPWVSGKIPLEGVPPGAVRFAVGAALGAMAQPIFMLGYRKIIKRFENYGDTPKPEGNGNA